MHESTQDQKLSLIEFPCALTLKVFGKLTDEFKSIVSQIVQKHLDQPLPKSAVSQRYSKNKNYLSLSITIQAQSRQQLDAIYQDLTKEPLVIMAL